MYSTGNPVPSSALEDMADNAQVFDGLVTKTSGTVTDRLGNVRRPFQQIVTDMGFKPLSSSFQSGATITEYNQCLLDSSTGTFYSWNGALPKVVPAGSTPATAGGIGTLLWVDRTDLMLRSELESGGSTIPEIASLKSDLASQTDALGSNLVNWHRLPNTYNTDTVAYKLSTTPVSPLEFTNLITSKPTPEDPTTWDWYPALAACMTEAGTTGQSVQLPPIKMKTSQSIQVPKGLKVYGCGGGGYTMEVQDPVAWRTVLIKTGGDTNGDHVIELLDGAHLYDVQVSPEFPDLVPYDTANYPTGTGNCSRGVTTGEGCYLQNVTVVSFADCGFLLNYVTKCVTCFAFKCKYGYLSGVDQGDASLVECTGMFCHEAGFWGRGGYWKVLGGRWEWNARHGVILGSSGMVVGATFDRNGWAGVFIPTGLEGNTITGNVFRRNGAGGDGVVGRTSWMTVGDDGYVATTDENSCHIRWEGQRRTVISGNYYSSGKDDSGGGADAPKHVYTCGVAGNAVEGLNVIGNHGDRGETDGGFATAYNGGGASVWGGVDSTIIANYGRRGTFLKNGIRSDFFGGGEPITGSAVASINVYVPIRTSGEIILRCSVFNQAKLARINFASTSLNDGFVTSFSNTFGAPVTAVAMANANTDLNYLIITLDAAYFVTSTVIVA